MPDPTPQRLLEVAQDAAYVAGRRTLAYFQAGVAVDTKSDDTPVTIADREAERILRERILAAFPDHAILGEEEGEHEGAAPYRWVVDPIDGTKAFVTGVPLYGVLVGVERDGETLAGVIYLPAIGEMIAACVGGGCTWNGRPCRTSTVTSLSEATIVCSSIRRAQKRSGAFETLAEATKLQRTWGDAFGYALIATGRAEVMLDPALSPWDVGPMPVILSEAGGRFSSWRGEPTIYGPDGVGTNGHLHESVLSILKTG